MFLKVTVFYPPPPPNVISQVTLVFSAVYVLGSLPLLSGRHVTVIAFWWQNGASYYFMADGTKTDFQKCSSIVACIIYHLSVFTFFAHSDFPKVFTSFVKTHSLTDSLTHSLSLSLYIYIYIHTHIHTYIHTYIHIYIINLHIYFTDVEGYTLIYIIHVL